jgi:hypothetical protein
MNERWKDLIKQAIQEIGPEDNPSKEETLKRYAELMVKEFSDLLWEESERLYEYSTECDDNSHESDEAEVVAEKCVDLIKMVEEHFGVKQ